MSFRGLAQGYDFSTLPKVVTHAQLGRMGACSWLTPWECYTAPDVQKAKDELEAAHNIILAFVNATNVFYQDAQANNAPGDVLGRLGDDVQKGLELVQQHSNLMSQFYSETGTGVSGLKGSGLGFVVFGMALAELAPILIGAVNGAIGWYIIYNFSQALREGAQALKSNADSSQAKFKRDGEYYMAWKDAMSKGQTPPAPPDDTAVKPTDWVTVALVGGSVVLAVMLLGKK